jgi:hypothetical protein
MFARKISLFTVCHFKVFVEKRTQFLAEKGAWPIQTSIKAHFTAEFKLRIHSVGSGTTRDRIRCTEDHETPLITTQYSTPMRLSHPHLCSLFIHVFLPVPSSLGSRVLIRPTLGIQRKELPCSVLTPHLSTCHQILVRNSRPTIVLRCSHRPAELPASLRF